MKDMTPVNLSIALILSAAVGGFTGLLLGGLFVELYVAIIAAFLGTVIVGNARNFSNLQLAVIFSSVEAGSRVSSRAIIGSVVATLIASVVVVELTRLGEFNWPVAIGALAGLFAGILMTIFLVLYGGSRPTDQSKPHP
jgi:hypothetical protein